MTKKKANLANDPAVVATPETTDVVLAQIKLVETKIKLVGDSPLICHAWSEKAKRQMLDKQMKKAKSGREAKDPQKDYEDSLYYMPDGSGYGFPSVGFKSAAVSACRFSEGVKMTEARGAFHISGDLVKIHGTPSMREDMVRIAMGTADIRYRAEFREWFVILPVRVNIAAISLHQLHQLFQFAGFGVGVGEWRPEKNGSFGLFHVGNVEDKT